jgi:hypothetical protein
MNLIGKADFRALLAVVVISLATRAGLACECRGPRTGATLKQVVIEARNKSKAVFSGTVVAITKKPGDFYVAVRFKIEESWKGTLSKEATVFTGQGGGDCGYKFEVGQRYLVYAYRYKDADLGTNICQRTASLIEAAEDLKVLGNAKFVGVRSQKSVKSSLSQFLCKRAEPKNC